LISASLSLSPPNNNKMSGHGRISRLELRLQRMLLKPRRKNNPRKKRKRKNELEKIIVMKKREHCDFPRPKRI